MSECVNVSNMEFDFFVKKFTDSKFAHSLIYIVALFTLSLT